MFKPILALGLLAACDCPQQYWKPTGLELMPNCHQPAVVTYPPMPKDCPMLDEPYWTAAWQPDHNYESMPPAFNPAPTLATVNAFVSNNPCSWVNYSEPEVNWMWRGQVEAPTSSIFGFDRYRGACGWYKTRSLADEVYSKVKARVGQRMRIWIDMDADLLLLVQDWACDKPEVDMIIRAPW